MALNQTEQFRSLLGTAKHILITFRQDGKGDSIASAAALSMFLKKLDKQIDVVCAGFELPQKFSFVKDTKNIQPNPPHLQQFMITVDVQESGVQELSYDVHDGKLQIYITPKSGFLTHKHIRTAQSAFRYDLIIVLDSPDLDSLGSLYSNYVELFYHVPIVNIDHQTHNERFGEMNMVNVNASSTAEILAGLMKDLDRAAIDKKIATALLTGMISATQSFKVENIKPNTLTLASELVDMGADRDFIIKKLYQTKSLAMLRLWGQALSQLSYDEKLGLVSTTITRDEFARAGAKEDELYDIIDELIANSPEAKMTLLLHEEANGDGPKKIHAVLNVQRDLDALTLLKGFNPKGDAKQVSVVLTDISLKEAEKKLVAEIRERVK